MTPGVAAVAAQAEVIWICAAFTDADRTAAHRWGAGSEDPADPVLAENLIHTAHAACWYS
jgi:hypothetical protein